MVSYGFVIFTCLTFLIKLYFTDDDILCPWLCYHINTPSGIEIICEGYYLCSKQSCTRYSICIIFQSELTSRVIGTVIGHKHCDCGNHLVWSSMKVLTTVVALTGSTKLYRTNGSPGNSLMFHT